MPTLGFIADIPGFGVSFVDDAERQAYAARPVAGVWPAHSPLLEAARDDDGLDDLLIIARGEESWLTDRAQADEVLGSLARSRIAGLVQCYGDGPAAVSSEVRDAARRHRVPLLIAASSMSLLRVARVISDERSREASAAAEEFKGIVDRLRHPATRRGDPCGVLEWLAEAAGGIALLLDARGSVTSWAPATGTPEVSIPAEQTAALASGPERYAALTVGAQAVRLYALGVHAPHPVLALASERRDVLQRAGQAITAGVAVLELLLSAQRADADRGRLEQATTALRVAVLQLLMDGHVLLAARTARFLCPALFEAAAVRLYLLDHGEAGRDAAEAACHAAAGGGALVVRCPVDHEHLIIIAAEPDGRDNGRGDGSDDVVDVGTALRAFVAQRPGYWLGASCPTTLDKTEAAYVEASRALAVARNVPERFAVYEQANDLALILDSGPARQWARAFTERLEELPASCREDIVNTVRLAMAFGRSGAARLTGLHRNTVAARIVRVCGLLEVDFTQLYDRAVLDLALRIRDLPRAPSGVQPVLDVDEILAAPAARQWAEILLSRLDAGCRNLRRTLTAWVASNAHVESAARTLDLHYLTVLDHLHAAEKLLQRPLLVGTNGEGGAELAGTQDGGIIGAHDVALALRILDPAAIPIRGRAQGRRSDS